ncbi:hypothetical protein SAMN04487939_107105 [Lysobacter sp. yr284]|uniref:hypothetical protein n=1 Tax=Lysobacter sp. yr284 TaxID=1761791 RepID=UPI00089AA3B8|nr:hypothetical protein [Lysobacter sp. yr284]SDY86889.1 hypothetical protein SAMN04487939_107105 [Lysobacter sp. yr284]
MRPLALRRPRFAVLAALALALAGCGRGAGKAATDAPQAASAAWQAAFDTSLHEHLRGLAERDDLQSQRDLLRLQSLLPDFHTRPAARLARERLGAIARVRAAAPADTEADWHHAELCVRRHPPASQGCDPDPALRRLQAAEPDNAAVWLLAADAADARHDPAGAFLGLDRAAAAPRYDLHYARHWSGVLDSLQRLPLPPLDPPTRRYLNNDDPDAATDADMRVVLATMAAPLPLPTAAVLGCREPEHGERAACTAVARLMADSDTLIGQTLGLSTMVRLSAEAADGAAWRERLRQSYWRNEQARHLPASPQFVSVLRGRGEVAAYEALLRAAGRERAPSDWLPQQPGARELVRTGRSGRSGEATDASAPPVPL